MSMSQFLPVEKNGLMEGAAVKAGQPINVKAQSSTIADAMTVLSGDCHGIENSGAGVVLKSDGASEQSKEIVINIPRTDQESPIQINLSPSMARIYWMRCLIWRYPYGCVEQTMSGFYRVIVVKAMRDLGSRRRK